MIEVRLERVGTVLRLRVPDELATAVAGLRHYREPDPAAPVTHEVTVTDAATPGFRYLEDATEFAAPIHQVTRDGLQVVVEQAFCRALDAAGRVVLHTSAVSDSRRVWAMWGHSGAGKTTLALGLHQRLGWPLISNGSLVVGLQDGVPTAIGTVKRHVKLRASSLRHRPGGAGSGSSTGGYEDKVDVDLGEFGADRVTLPLPIERLIFVRLVAALPGALVADLDPRRIAVQLYEDMVRHLHGGEFFVFGGDGRVLCPVPSAATDAGHRARVRLVEALTARSTALTGPLDDCLAVLTGAGSARSHRPEVERTGA
ncbi:hypothetical protein [Umezawaea sp.]|uniref:hypothetical protein n=1 Tax=Umezawaea sp. TaxID=1955258 RepID=UPI002ED45F74